jgi:hypothetical protein
MGRCNAPITAPAVASPGGFAEPRWHAVKPPPRSRSTSRADACAPHRPRWPMARTLRAPAACCAARASEEFIPPPIPCDPLFGEERAMFRGSLGTEQAARPGRERGPARGPAPGPRTLGLHRRPPPSLGPRKRKAGARVQQASLNRRIRNHVDLSNASAITVTLEDGSSPSRSVPRGRRREARAPRPRRATPRRPAANPAKNHCGADSRSTPVPPLPYCALVSLHPRRAYSCPTASRVSFAELPWIPTTLVAPSTSHRTAVASLLVGETRVRPPRPDPRTPAFRCAPSGRSRPALSGLATSLTGQRTPAAAV